MAVRARERLLRTARELFYAEGVRAVGVERLLQTSGVGRASFYRHFASKAELVTAMLSEYDIEYRERLQARVEELGGAPLAVFDAAAEDAEHNRYRGCAFLNVLAESTEPEQQIRRAVVDHKQAMTDYLADLLESSNPSEAGALAAQWLLLLDGASSAARYRRDTTSYTEARQLAEATLRRTSTTTETGLTGP
ncbi:TetR/AcrR family transcriptional regulator [Microbacterium sp. MYb62]|uniref:TetR/AcrR family transcriptional regulator n=1 Tax=Microbacterium sp. MYb62 TaxID=1848690 RepID=UPI000CFB814F|nr:TetR/AcrR family transcriptional regulator [Microbacterium sp. MYb62]PRB14117.1 TetR family transcriptional regulator [Microbacterium sp. MYb62]